MSMIFRKTSYSLVILFAAMLLGALYLVWTQLESRMREDMKIKGLAIADGIGSGIKDPSSDTERLQKLLIRFKEGYNLAYIWVSDQKGHIQAHTFKGQVPDVCEDIASNKQVIPMREINLDEIGDVMDLMAELTTGKKGYIHVGLSKDTLLDTRLMVVFRLTAVLLLGLLSALFLAFISSGQLVKALDAASSIAHRASEGDFKLQADARGPAEAGRLVQSVQGMVRSLALQIGGAKSHASMVSQGVDQICQSNLQQKERLEGLQEVSVQANAASAQLAQISQELWQDLAEVLRQAKTSLRQSERSEAQLQAMEQMLDAFLGVSKSLAAIIHDVRAGVQFSAGLVESVREVADQASLLSLNAAIEAEKAKDAGKGFHVVADEMLRLSNMSSELARSTQSSVHTMQETLTQGQQQVDRLVEQVDLRTQDARRAMAHIRSTLTQIPPLLTQLSQMEPAVKEGAGQSAHLAELSSRLKGTASLSLSALQRLLEASKQLQQETHDLKKDLSHFDVS